MTTEGSPTMTTPKPLHHRPLSSDEMAEVRTRAGFAVLDVPPSRTFEDWHGAATLDRARLVATIDALRTPTPVEPGLRDRVVAAAVAWVVTHDALTLGDPTGPLDDELLEAYTGACNDLLAIVTQNRAALATTPDTLDERLREFLWANHGHGEHLYGDDGEMQCGACLPEWDYRRMPLATAIAAARACPRRPSQGGPIVSDRLVIWLIRAWLRVAIRLRQEGLL